jgi:hypothetical protein
MKKDKLSELFRIARAESPPAAPERFEHEVMRAVGRQTNCEPVSLVDQLGALFPRLTLAAAAVIVCCSLILSSTGQSSLGDKVTELSQQWLFAAD